MQSAAWSGMKVAGRRQSRSMTHKLILYMTCRHDVHCAGILSSRGNEMFYPVHLSCACHLLEIGRP